MRFTCEKNMLVMGLNIAGRTVAQKSSLSVIEGILCKAGQNLSLTGYNMETAITYEIESDVSDVGECILPAKLFGDIVRDYPTLCASAQEGTYTLLAVKNAAGRKALLVVDYGGSVHDLEIAVSGVEADAKASATILDWTHDLEPHAVKFENGKLTIRKNDSYSAAFLVEFK